MRQKQPGKSKLRATGPYWFEEYHGTNGAVAVIVAPDGTMLQVSVADLVPYCGGLRWEHSIMQADQGVGSSDDEGKL